MNLAYDLDGVIADFNTPYSALMQRQSGIQFPPVTDTWPSVWGYDRATLEADGVSRADATAIINEVWTEIKNSSFWGTLPLLGHGAETLRQARQLRAAGHNIYFITSRPGRFAKLLSEDWLMRHDVPAPAVFIATNAEDKARIGGFLSLDVFIDDKPENCVTMLGVAHYVYLQDASWNKGWKQPGVQRTARPALAVNEVLKLEGMSVLKKVA